MNYATWPQLHATLQHGKRPDHDILGQLRFGRNHCRRMYAGRGCVRHGGTCTTSIRASRERLRPEFTLEKSLDERSKGKDVNRGIYGAGLAQRSGMPLSADSYLYVRGGWDARAVFWGP